MALLFRAMKEETQGLPAIGPTARTIGIRPGLDVPATNAADIVSPGDEGMSVSPDDPHGLPYFRRPPKFQGTGVDPVWMLDERDLPAGLCFRPDPGNPKHGFVEPAHPMPLQDFQRLLADTQRSWQKQ